jgi:hypothetical protein
MSKLIGDVLYLVFEDLQDDRKTLYSCLLVNKTWSENVIPILWRNPWKCLTNESKYFSFFRIIISHLSDEMKNNLKVVNLPTQKLLFNYISFCKHLDLSAITKIIDSNRSKYEINIPTIKSEIFNLFINENTKFTHLYLPQYFDHQIHLIPGAKHCFSEIVFLSCFTSVSDEILVGLVEICQSIKKLELTIEMRNNSYSITKFIDTFEQLNYVSFKTHNIIEYHSSTYYKSLHTALENSLKKHVHTIQYFKTNAPPTSKILSSLINLKGLDLSLEIKDIYLFNLENISLPNLQVLKSNIFQINILGNLIINANRSLTKLSVDNDIPHNEVENKSIIQAIYQNCPNLMYLKLMFISENILELEQLLINCKYLNGFHFIIMNLTYLDKLFEMLTTSSPTNLSKFKFNINSYETIKLESLKLFFDDWKGRNPLLLQISKYSCTDIISSIEEYKSEGIIKKFDYLHNYSEDFEW